MLVNSSRFLAKLYRRHTFGTKFKLHLALSRSNQNRRIRKIPENKQSFVMMVPIFQKSANDLATGSLFLQNLQIVRRKNLRRWGTFKARDSEMNRERHFLWFDDDFGYFYDQLEKFKSLLIFTDFVYSSAEQSVSCKTQMQGCYRN